jgi:hypothetical protein
MAATTAMKFTGWKQEKDSTGTRPCAPASCEASDYGEIRDTARGSTTTLNPVQLCLAVRIFIRYLSLDLAVYLFRAE